MNSIHAKRGSSRPPKTDHYTLLVLAVEINARRKRSCKGLKIGVAKPLNGMLMLLNM